MVLTGLAAALEGGLAALAGAGASCLFKGISFAEGTSVGPLSSPSQSKLSGRVSGASQPVCLKDNRLFGRCQLEYEE
jgi:hypothetical protein